MKTSEKIVQPEYIKPTKNFKMPKRIKSLISLSQITDPEVKRAFKQMMIQAQLASEVKARPKGEKGERNKTE